MLDIAERQWRDYQAHNPGTHFAEQRDALDLGQAYSLQSAVSRLRIEAGDRVVGYKVGCTGAGTIEQFGMQAQFEDTSIRANCADPAKHSTPRLMQI